MLTTDTFLVPDWLAPPRVRALSTTRAGGVSLPPYGRDAKTPGGLNLGTHVGDLPEHVAQNRALLQQHLPCQPLWLEQVHGCAVATASDSAGVPVADASISQEADRICAIMTADCLPVLLCDAAGTVVGAAHAGWRGLCSGVIEQTISCMAERVQAQSAPVWMAWLGPAIGPDAFEVGPEVRTAFMDAAKDEELVETNAAFRGHGTAGRFFADLYALARLRLARAGCTNVSGGDRCTFNEADRFYSYRRDGRTGRMASLVWLAD